MRKINWFGIDFGTTNTAAVSFTGIDDSKRKILTYGDDEGRPMPSIVAIHKKSGDVVVGRDVKDKRHSMLDEYEIIDSIKSHLAENTSWVIAGKTWTPTDIASEIFKSIKSQVLKYSGSDLDEAVIAVPVGFSAAKKNELRKAAQNAGFEIKMFITEPTAAFCSNYQQLKNCRNIAVFDWGGGTLDIAIIRLRGNHIDELATEGMSCAGADIDRKLAEKMHARFTRGKEPVKSLDEIDSSSKDTLLAKCERLKCDFADEDLLTMHMNRYDEYGPVREEMQYDYFSLLVENEVDKAIECLERAISKAGLNTAEIDKILCVGGSSKLRPLQEKLAVKYGQESIYYPERVMWDISEGAAKIAANPGGYCAGKSIGMVLSDGSFFELVKPGQEIPSVESVVRVAITENARDARFIFTDSSNADERSFSENFTVVARGFLDEHFIVSSYIDRNFIFKLKIQSNRQPESEARVWAYSQLKISYQIAGDR